MIDLATKKIVVAGGSGYLGTHLVRALVERGVPRASISVPRSSDCDLRQWEHCVRAVAGQEILFDLATITGDLLLRAKFPGTLLYDNLLMGVQLIEAARQAGAEKVVTIGSAIEYPHNAPAPLREDDLWMGQQEPANIPYGFAKKILLVQGQAYRRQYGMNVIHLLLTNTYGPGERVESGYFVPSVIQKVLAAKKSGASHIEAWGTGEPMRDFIYVDDAVEGIIAAAERYDEEDPINLGTGVGVSIRDFIGLASRIAGFSGQIRWDATKPNGQLHRVMDMTRAEAKLGFRAKTSLEAGLKKTIEWHEHGTQVRERPKGA